ncbi:MAG: hypothetical protein JXB39_03375 [Deltaproteobacteria bacterium]|nr:hypothetical protein [Deltaproteobacteria bacterium]
MHVPIQWIVLAACRCAPAHHEGGAAAPGHFEDAPSLLRAVEAGDLPAAAVAARGMDGGWPTEEAGRAGRRALEDLHAAVGFIVAAADAGEAADGLARVAESCGACHLAERVSVGRPSPEVSGHARATEALWWAVVSGDSARGREVAARLAEDPPRAREGMRSSDAADRVLEAARAARTDLPPSDLLATVVGACGDCHRAAADATDGVGPG